MEKQLSLPLIEVEEVVPDFDLIFYFSEPVLDPTQELIPNFWSAAIRLRAARRARESLFRVSPPAQKAANPASGVGVFCNGSTAPNKGRSLTKGSHS